ncbi:tetratricopeptide repeat protein [Algibacter amylolyticus]|uniref:Tetratricopeptide repeat protein n=1 Tax=Algibacter amylolyticus TaxID=1608400 RepID=A0A5M7AYL3_9FLAO|nr:tetratricopeptide repeat protein [Algibacter amylolyticus]KAA5822332.1 tetratricopeptide repeat protein [Algibacter amylolyticus]TSJ73482.1 tetratricopeptide repeat protein [Algibacter amylolyticus]
MSLKKLLFLSLILTSFSGFSQNMQEGFTYLETGKYAEAETYFKGVLKEYPDNKTARLCLGRAIGLNGNPEQANSLFTELLADYPTDFEVKLNYGESLLWTSNFPKAKTYFKSLIEEDPKSFPALLSYANTLSNLKEYENAIIYVNKALDVLPGNPNALTSKKYMYLGYAYQNQQAQNYAEAERLLKENLTLFNNDKDTLLNLANLYLIAGEFDKAETTYNTIGETPENKTIALNGLALVKHLKSKDKEALQLSEQAFLGLGAQTDAALVQPTTERYIQALIWNKKYKTANTLISNLIETKPNENWLLALRATLNIYKSDFKKSVADYNRILVNDSSSFDGNLGKANALKAIGNYDDAYQSAENTLTFYDKQKDATNFIKTLNTSFTPFWETKASYSFDNGDNKAFGVTTKIEFPTSTKFKWLANYGYRTTSNKVTDFNATSNDFSLGLAYQLLPNLTFKGTAGVTSAKASTNDYTQFVTDLALNIKPFKLQVLDVGYKSEIQSFNAELLNREIVMHNIYANYSLSTNFNLGWFTQYFHTWQNDNNARNLLFTSLYYNILAKPSLKTGLNYQYITFKNQVPTIYFSPEQFNAGEVFVNIIKDEAITKPKAWFYELTAATGLQYIEDDESQSTYRIQGKLGYKFSERALLNLYGTRSNIASATAAGFTFNEIGLRFKWYLFDAPVFRK